VEEVFEMEKATLFGLIWLCLAFCGLVLRAVYAPISPSTVEDTLVALFQLFSSHTSTFKITS